MGHFRGSRYRGRTRHRAVIERVVAFRRDLLQSPGNGGGLTRGMTELLSIEQYRRPPHAGAGGGTQRRGGTFFERSELQQILDVYSRKVMAGEWLDYAIGLVEEGAEFAVYGRVSIVPLYRLIKLARPGRGGGRWQLCGRGVVLKTSANLEPALKLLGSRRPRAVDAG